MFAERRNWVHQSGNTFHIYNLRPQLYNKYGKFVGHVDTDNHWLHETDHLLNHELLLRIEPAVFPWAVYKQLELVKQ